MSGHSKWATIHRDKEVNDNKRGAAFTKFAHAITIAARQKEEYKLRLMIEKARAVNMPKDNIQRAIDRATGAGAESLVEVLFEGFLPGGVVVVVEGLSDSKLRMTQEIRTIIEKNGGTLGSIGSVHYLFEHVVEIQAKNNSEVWVEHCSTDKLPDTKEGLESLGYKIESTDLIYKPITTIKISDPEVRLRIETILDKLDNHDEVSGVYTNYA